MKFAVIDTETTWGDKVMSIGIVVADGNTKKEIESKYFILTPEYKNGGMFSGTLNAAPDVKTVITSRIKAISEIKSILCKANISTIFAYNANFDYKHLPELDSYTWVDIMKIAAYKQYNRFIPRHADCCGTGRLKSGYGVEAILNMMVDDYTETHNAFYDALDELRIVELLGLDINIYKNATIN